jgi:hypothetical protein
MAPIMTFDMTARMDNGSKWKVRADQREFAAWELQDFGTPFAVWRTRMFTCLRFLAWHAGKRQQLHTLTWEQFSEQCAEVSDERAAEDDAEDPGNPAA